jgi:hypothetical protein
MFGFRAARPRGGERHRAQCRAPLVGSRSRASRRSRWPMTRRAGAGPAARHRRGGIRHWHGRWQSVLLLDVDHLLGRIRERRSEHQDRAAVVVRFGGTPGGRPSASGTTRSWASWVAGSRPPSTPGRFPAQVKVYDAEPASQDCSLFRSLFLKNPVSPSSRTRHHPDLRRGCRRRARLHRLGTPRPAARRYCVPEDSAAHAGRAADECVCALTCQRPRHHPPRPQAREHPARCGRRSQVAARVAATQFAFDATRELPVGFPAYMSPEQVERRPAR